MANTGNNQSWPDIALQETGTLENLLLIAAYNNISITDAPATGTPYTIPTSVANNAAVLGELTGVKIGTRG